jgi:hypothetical protein
MFDKWKLSFLTIAVALVATGSQAWKDKRIAEWTEDDAKEVMTESPWAKTVTPSMSGNANVSNGPQRSGGGMGRGGGMGAGGIGIGLPGMGGMGRRGGMGGGSQRGGGYPPGGQPRGTDPATEAGSPPRLTLRWESALPIREAELITHTLSPDASDEAHYAIGVYGLPSRMVTSDSRNLAAQLKGQASIKRDGKKDLKPSRVDVLDLEGGPVIIYLFPRSAEITARDNRMEFDAKIGRLELKQAFYVDEMNFQGKLEL